MCIIWNYCVYLKFWDSVRIEECMIFYTFMILKCGFKSRKGMCFYRFSGIVKGQRPLNKHKVGASTCWDRLAV